MTKPILHICMVSEQPMPNYLPTLMEDLRPERILLLISREMRERRRQEPLVRQFRAAAIKVEERTVDAYHPEDVRQAIVKARQLLNTHTPVCNLTGGTKMMTVGAYLACAELNIPCMYVDTFNGLLHRVLPEQGEESLTSRIGVREYLGLYGYTIEEPPRVEGAADLKRFEAASRIINNWGRLGKGVSALHNLVHRAQGYENRIQSGPDQKESLNELLELFGDLGELRVEGNRIKFKRSPESLSYVGGVWFEDYVYGVLKAVEEELGIDEILSGVKVTSARGVSNELDVVFAANNRLYLIECKAKLFKGPGSKQDATEPVYKLDTLREVMSGTFGKAMIASTWPIPQGPSARCTELNIRICDGTSLPTLAESVRRWIRS